MVAASKDEAERAARAALAPEEESDKGVPPLPKATSQADVPGDTTPLARLRCKVCETIIPIFTEERPLQIVCPNCGKGGVLK